MQKQIAKLESANEVLQAVYKEIRLQSLTGVVRENIQSKKTICTSCRLKQFLSHKSGNQGAERKSKHASSMSKLKNLLDFFRSFCIQGVNKFDRQFLETHCSLFTITTALQYVFDHQSLPDFENIQDRVAFIEKLEKVYSQEEEVKLFNSDRRFLYK